jgi:uncharacterized glyoxalase superfamily protein PhnB
MTEKPAVVPEGYHTVTPWIIAKGADGLVHFIEKTFGGKEKPGSRILDADGLIGHVEVQLGDSAILLFDHRKGWPETPAFLRVYVENAEAVMKKAKDAGATVVTNVTPLFFGEKVGRIRDPWGNIWWIHERTEELGWQEMEKRMLDPAEIERMRYVQESLDLVLQRYNN